MKKVKAIAILLVVVGLGYYAWRVNTKTVQSEAEPVGKKASDPEAVRLLEQAATAAKTAKVIRYDADYRGSGDREHIGGIVELDRNRKWVKMSVADRRLPNYHDELFDAATDGKRVVLVSHMDMTYTHGAFPEQARILRKGNDLLIQQFGRDDAFEAEIKSYAVHEGRRSVGDVVCDVVYVKHKQAGEYSRWFFGPDGLPRCVERISNAYDDIPDGHHVVKTLILSDIDLQPELVETEFQLARPEDYEDIELK